VSHQHDEGKTKSFKLAVHTRSLNIDSHVHFLSTNRYTNRLSEHIPQMFPTEPQITGKRKAEESNPLLNAAAAKRAKKDVRLSCLCY
jgi:hypothetical protein